jgi:hypothetical protein
VMGEFADVLGSATIETHLWISHVTTGCAADDSRKRCRAHAAAREPAAASRDWPRERCCRELNLKQLLPVARGMAARTQRV